MKSVDLRSENVDLSQLLHMAEDDAVLVVTEEGREFIAAEADDFDAEAEALRKSARFQSFLDLRMSDKVRIRFNPVFLHAATVAERDAPDSHGPNRGRSDLRCPSVVRSKLLSRYRFQS